MTTAAMTFSAPAPRVAATRPLFRGIPRIHTKSSSRGGGHRRGKPHRSVVVARGARDGGDDGGVVPPGLAGGLYKLLGFFRKRVDTSASRTKEDDEESAVGRITTAGDVWVIELSLFLREPSTPLASSAAGNLERVSLALECSFAPKDRGLYPSRGRAVQVVPGFAQLTPSLSSDGTKM